MRNALRMSSLLLSPLTLMCSSPVEPAGNVGPQNMMTPAMAGNSGAPNTAGSAGSVNVVPGAGGTNGGSAGTGESSAGSAGLPGSNMAGAAGMSGAAGAGGGGTAFPSGPTAGCKQPAPVEEPQKWLERPIDVANLPADQQALFGKRRYFVRLPVAYDHSKAYPIVFYGPGCSAKNVETTPMMDQIKNDAIHVFLLQQGDCFSTSGYPSPEVPYFTQALDEVQGKYCTDAGKVFVSGYSSGGWLSNVLACALGPRIRGIGTAAGGLHKEIVDGYKCSTPAAGIFYSGEMDTTNPADKLDKNGFPQGVFAARDRLISSNGCDPAAKTTYPSNSICQAWTQGCINDPVLFCVGPGDGHGKGDGKFGVSNGTFWDVWSKLPPR